MTFLYEHLLKPLFFLQDPEVIHNRFVRVGRILGHIPPARWILSFVYQYRNPKLQQLVAGITFANPVGLSAGFDKECELLKVLPSIGFGYEEVGSITAEPYDGNPRPRLVRLPADKGIIVNYGLKNRGASVLRRKLLGKRFRFPVGVSIAKTNKRFKTEKAKLDDWLRGIKLLKGCGDYLTINLSCPNLADTANYCDPKLLRKLLARIEKEKVYFTQPVFLKLSADLTEKRIDAIIKLCTPKRWITGFIISNLTKDRRKLTLKTHPSIWEGKKGGISGKHVYPRSLALIRHVRKRAGERFVLIACGGIFTTRDAYAYIRAGASLVQMITGMIYRGPGTIKEINKGLVRLLEEDGYKNISEAIGAETRFQE